MIKNYFYVSLEKLFGVDLSTTIKVEDIKDVDTTNGTNSGPSRSFGLMHIAENIPFSSHDRILDIGCGKGAAIIGLSFFTPCKIIDGLEYSQEIVDICEKNLNRIGLNQIGETRSMVFHKNARLFQIYQNYNYFYMYDPFRKETFYKVIDKIIESIKLEPREVRIIYANPYEHDYLISKGFLVEQEIKTDFYFPNVKVYRFIP